ncbi:MAG: nucleotide exchange factor GrpE [Helicobacteraceae bacterium]|jgi:molecular chaperone GrpE|nr:nucleotide exchange factor GrpE [Helicobacteraceae bacterium]
MSEEKNNEETQSIEEVLEEQLEAREESDIEEVEDEIGTLQREVTALQDKYARVHADFENIKKRLEREKYQALEYANEKFAKDIIPVLDALDGAIKAKSMEADPAVLLDKVSEGVELTMKQFLNVLEKHGVTAVSEDEPFDPNVHHAVQQVDSPDHESGQIVSTFQKGYKYKERTLRDAMVVIAN